MSRYLRVNQALVLLLLAFYGCHGSPVAAHPIEYHMQALTPAEVERAITGLENIAGELEGRNSAGGLAMPDYALNATAILWALEDAMLAADRSSLALSPGMRAALVSAGYADSDDMVEEWEIEAQLVLEAWEVLRKGLNLERVQAAYAALESEQSGLTEAQALVRERAVLSDHQLLRATAKDLELVSRYRDRLDRLGARMGYEAVR